MSDDSSAIAAAARCVIAAIVILALWFGRAVLMPLALSAVIAFMLSPIVSRLTKARLPRPAAVALVISGFLAVTVYGSVVFSAQVIELTASLSTYRTNITEKMKTVTGASLQSGPLKRAVDAVDALEREFEKQLHQSGADESIRVVLANEPAPGLMGMLRALQSSLGPIEILLLTLFYTAILLSEQYDLVDRLVRLAGTQHLTESTSALGDAGERISKLFLAQGALNAGFGVSIGVGLWLLGIPNPALWGMTAFILRFIPWIGVVLSAAAPLLLAAAVMPGWALVLAVFGLFAVSELLLSNVVEPIVLGRHAGLSPLAIIATASFWSVIWGPVGLLLAAPMTVALIVVGEYVPSLNFLSLLLGDRPPLTPAQEYYLRLLTGDASAAAERFETEMQTVGPLDIADRIVTPALALAAADHRTGHISEAKAQEIADAMEEVEDILADALAKRADLPSPVAAAANRIVVPSHGPIDVIAASFAAFMLSRMTGAPCAAVEQAAGLLALASLKDETVDTILLLTVGGVSRSHLRLLARRAVADYPRARIMLCDWSEGAAEDDAAAAKAIPASVVRCPSLARASQLLEYRPQAQEAPATEPGAALAS